MSNALYMFALATGEVIKANGWAAVRMLCPHNSLDLKFVNLKKLKNANIGGHNDHKRPHRSK